MDYLALVCVPVKEKENLWIETSFTAPKIDLGSHPAHNL